ncbi:MULTISPECIES: hypothetical protein [unclassified Lysobacter]|uniref:hypothetical protein n=1 Tax=unclassified Lysobacter TaxID=2635362 RepID=UPI001C235DC6|nr:hypothetical protein [Lysobacter sp. MMG2]MBU8976185.1 hypothetical protein [Lysobacter sp. MMG2]
MNALKVCAGALLLVAGVGVWKTYVSTGRVDPKAWVSEHVGSGGKAEGDSARGFKSMPLPDGVPSRGVVVFAPKHCTSDAARRTDELVRHLSKHGVAYSRTDSASFNSITSQEEATRVMSVMNGPVPIVYVNGRAKANPTPQEVVAEFRGKKAG